MGPDPPGVDASVNCTGKSVQPLVGEAVKLTTGVGLTVIVHDFVLVPLALVALYVTVYVPGFKKVHPGDATADEPGLNDQEWLVTSVVALVNDTNKGAQPSRVDGVTFMTGGGAANAEKLHAVIIKKSNFLKM